MELIRLNDNQFSKEGWTHLFKFTYEDLTESTDNTDQALTIMALVEGDLVMTDKCFIDTVTDPAGLTALNLSLGVTGALEQFVAAGSVLAAADPNVLVGKDATAYATVIAGKNLVLNADPGANTQALADLTAGEWHVWFTLSKRADRANVQA